VGTTRLTFGKCKQEGRTSLQRSFCGVRSATTHSENTAKHSDFSKGRIVKLAFQLQNLGYSEAYLKTLIRALNNVASQVDIDSTTAVSEKLNAPELKKIRLYDLRHYFATMLYYRTKDILLVKEKLGHKSINNTLVYTHLVNFNDKDEFCSATAQNIEEAKKLVEQGFDYVTELDGVKLFRKRK
jgi:hypothetical protein